MLEHVIKELGAHGKTPCRWGTEVCGVEFDAGSQELASHILLIHLKHKGAMAMFTNMKKVGRLNPCARAQPPMLICGSNSSTRVVGSTAASPSATSSCVRFVAPLSPGVRSSFLMGTPGTCHRDAPQQAPVPSQRHLRVDQLRHHLQRRAAARRPHHDLPPRAPGRGHLPVRRDIRQQEDSEPPRDGPLPVKGGAATAHQAPPATRAAAGCPPATGETACA